MVWAALLALVVCFCVLAPHANAQDSAEHNCSAIDNSVMRTNCEVIQSLAVQADETSLNVDMINEQIAGIQLVVSSLEAVDVNSVRRELRADLARERDERLEQARAILAELVAIQGQLAAHEGRIEDLEFFSGVITARLEEILDPETGLIPQLQRDTQNLEDRVSQLEVDMDANNLRDDAQDEILDEFDVSISGRGIFGSLIGGLGCFAFQLPLAGGVVNLVQRDCAGLSSHGDFIFSNSVEFSTAVEDAQRLNLGVFVEDQVNEGDIRSPGNTAIGTFLGGILDYEFGSSHEGHLLAQLGAGPGWVGSERELEFVWTAGIGLGWDFLAGFDDDDMDECP